MVTAVTAMKTQNELQSWSGDAYLRVVEKLTTRLLGFQSAPEAVKAGDGDGVQGANADDGELKTVLGESVDLNMEFAQRLVRAAVVDCDACGVAESLMCYVIQEAAEDAIVKLSKELVVRRQRVVDGAQERTPLAPTASHRVSCLSIEQHLQQEREERRGSRSQQDKAESLEVHHSHCQATALVEADHQLRCALLQDQLDDDRGGSEAPVTRRMPQQSSGDEPVETLGRDRQVPALKAENELLKQQLLEVRARESALEVEVGAANARCQEQILSVTTEMREVCVENDRLKERNAALEDAFDRHRAQLDLEDPVAARVRAARGDDRLPRRAVERTPQRWSATHDKRARRDSASTSNREYRNRLVAIFSAKDPKMVGEVDELLKSYEGAEDTFIESMELKYEFVGLA